MHVDRSDWLPVQTEISGDNNYELTLWQRTFDDKKIPSQICCTVKFPQTVSATRHKMLLELSEGMLPLAKPSQIKLPFELAHGIQIGSDRKIPEKYSVPSSILPPTLKNLFSENSRHGRELITRYVKLIRWIQLSSGKHSPFAHVEFKWSFDGTRWFYAPTAYQLSMSVSIPIRTSSKAQKIVKEALMSTISEPLSQELIRESFELVSSNPRSSLLIGVTALETGIKELVAWLLPGTDLLLDDFPSPPIVKLLQESIPNILALQNKTINVIPYKDDQVKELRKWVQVRNKIAHGSSQLIDGDELRRFLLLARRTLYAFDECRGLEWANEHVNDLNPEGFGSSLDSGGGVTEIEVEDD